MECFGSPMEAVFFFPPRAPLRSVLLIREILHLRRWGTAFLHVLCCGVRDAPPSTYITGLGLTQPNGDGQSEGGITPNATPNMFLAVAATGFPMPGPTVLSGNGWTLRFASSSFCVEELDNASPSSYVTAQFYMAAPGWNGTISGTIPNDNFSGAEYLWQ